MRPALWNRFLLLLTVSGGLAGSCGKTRYDYILKGEFHYVNATTFKVALTIKGAINGPALQEYSLDRNDTLKLFVDGETTKKVAYPSDYGRPPVAGDSTILRFSDTTCYHETAFSGAILQNIDSYSSKRRGERDYLFTLVIDSTLLRLSSDCR